MITPTFCGVQWWQRGISMGLGWDGVPVKAPVIRCLQRKINGNHNQKTSLRIFWGSVSSSFACTHFKDINAVIDWLFSWSICSYIMFDWLFKWESAKVGFFSFLLLIEVSWSLMEMKQVRVLDVGRLVGLWLIHYDYDGCSVFVFHFAKTLNN